MIKASNKRRRTCTRIREGAMGERCRGDKAGNVRGQPGCWRGTTRTYHEATKRMSAGSEKGLARGKKVTGQFVKTNRKKQAAHFVSNQNSEQGVAASECFRVHGLVEQLK